MHEAEFDNDRLHPALAWCYARAIELDRQDREGYFLQYVSQQLQRRIVSWAPMRQGVRLETLEGEN